MGRVRTGNPKQLFGQCTRRLRAVKGRASAPALPYDDHFCGPSALAAVTGSGQHRTSQSPGTWRGGFRVLRTRTAARWRMRRRPGILPHAPCRPCPRRLPRPARYADSTPPAPAVGPAPGPRLPCRSDGRKHESKALAGGRSEHAVAEAAVVVPVFIQRRADALQEARRAQQCIRRRRSAAAQFTLDPADENAQHPRRQRRVVAQPRSQALGAWTTPTAASAPAE